MIVNSVLFQVVIDSTTMVRSTELVRKVTGGVVLRTIRAWHGAGTWITTFA